MKARLTLVLTVAIALSMMTIGCTGDDYMKEVVAKGEEQPEQPEQPEEPEVLPITDDFSEALAAVEGVSDVRIEDSSNGARFYYFSCNEPIDHNNPALGTFKLRACINLSSDGTTAPVALVTRGYGLRDTTDDMYYSIPTIAKYLNATTLWVEHRYCGESQPEPKSNIEFTYLYADQTSQDLHAVVSKIKQTVLKQSGKWVSTGVSNDGITTALYAYHSDKYGWNDIDLYMPFCAPFLEGTPESCSDQKVGQYIVNECGKNYAPDTKQGIAYERLRKVPRALLENKELRDACMRRFHVTQYAFYLDILINFGRSEENATAGVLFIFYYHLFGKFSYCPFKMWADLVPEVDDMVDFIFMTDDELIEELTKTRTVYSDEQLKKRRYQDSGFAYDVQATRELGNVRYDYSLVDGMHLEDSTTDFGHLALEISKLFEYSTLMSRYAHQWDGGQLMKSFRQWVKTQNKYKMIFTYSANDPWTGGAIDESSNLMVKRMIVKEGTHSDKFMGGTYSDEERETIEKYINDYLYN